MKARRLHSNRLLQYVAVRSVENCGSDGDLLIGLQLTHSGRYSFQRPILVQHDPLLDPRTILDKATGAAVTSEYPLIGDDELDRLLDVYAAAASLAYRIGFDFVDLKQCHRYLLNELLAARTRPGKYGGSFENRSRWICALAARIRADNPSKLIATRLSVHDGLPYMKGPDDKGMPVPTRAPAASCWGSREDDPLVPNLTEPIALVGKLREAGVELVNVTLGNPYASPHLLRPFEYPPPDGYETPEHPLFGVDRHFRLTAEIQGAFPDLAVVGSGYSWLQAFFVQAGAANVRTGRTTFVGVGRGALSQPEFGRRIMAGESLDPKAPVPHFQLLHSAHALQAQRPRPVCRWLSAVRQRGLRTNLGGSAAISWIGPSFCSL